jgi:hypothetical protein
MKFQTLLGLYIIWRNRALQNEKPDYLVFATSTSCLIFFYLGPLMPFSPFPCFKTPWIFKSSNLALVMFMFQNCQNRTVRNRKPEHPVLPALPNLVINICPLPFSYACVWKGILDQIWPQDDVHGVSSAIFCAKSDNSMIARFLTQVSCQTLG